MNNLRTIEWEDLTDSERVLFNNRIFICLQTEIDNLTGEEIERELILYPEDLLN